MRFLPDERLYWDADHCLRFLRELEVPDEDEAPAGEPYHLYWSGPFTNKQAFAVKSLLATQRRRGEVCLWLDAENGYPGHERNEALRSLASEISVRPFDAALECRGTPLEGRSQLQEHPFPLERANLLRLVTLYNHGGVYLDLDTMLLRDLSDLFEQPFMTEDFAYRWSADLPYANNAVLRFRRGSENARKLLERSAEEGTCNPTVILRFEGAEEIDLTVLPCSFLRPALASRRREVPARGSAVRRIRGLLSKIQLALPPRPGRPLPPRVLSGARSRTTGTTIGTRENTTSPISAGSPRSSMRSCKTGVQTI